MSRTPERNLLIAVSGREMDEIHSLLAEGAGLEESLFHLAMTLNAEDTKSVEILRLLLLHDIKQERLFWYSPDQYGKVPYYYLDNSMKPQFKEENFAQDTTPTRAGAFTLLQAAGHVLSSYVLSSKDGYLRHRHASMPQVEAYELSDTRSPKHTGIPSYS